MKVQTYEEVFGKPLTIRDLVEGFDEDTKTGRVRAFGGNLNVRPPYQREFIYEAIDVSKTSYIPCDYDGIMGVPITWVEKYNPDQFEIIGKANNNGAPKINGKNKYTRILIRRKDI